MGHRLVVLAAVVAVAGLGACSRDKSDRPTPQAQPPAAGASTPVLPGGSPAGPSPGLSPGASGRPGPGQPVDPAGAAIGHPRALPTGNQIAATGVGPYTIGQDQAVLAQAGLVGPVSNGSAGCDTGSGTARWGRPALIFLKNKLVHIKITSRSVATASGVEVGSAEASVRGAYPEGQALSARGTTAWYAPIGDFALLFRMTGGKVAAIESGPASTLSITYTGGPGC